MKPSSFVKATVVIASLVTCIFIGKHAAGELRNTKDLALIGKQVDAHQYTVDGLSKKIDQVIQHIGSIPVSRSRIDLGSESSGSFEVSTGVAKTRMSIQPKGGTESSLIELGFSPDGTPIITVLDHKRGTAVTASLVDLIKSSGCHSDISESYAELLSIANGSNSPAAVPQDASPGQ